MATLDFTKCPSDERVTLTIGPSANGALGVTLVGEPLAAELNNTGGTSGMLPASSSASWSDASFGVQASDTNNEPSWADTATFEEFGKSNYGGSLSFWHARDLSDTSNPIAAVENLLMDADTLVDIAMRIDGDVKTTASHANGDFASVFRCQVDGESNPFNPGESKRYTKNFAQKSEFSHFVVVGDHAITSVAGPSESLAAGAKGRLRFLQQGRDVTCYLTITSDDATVIEVYPGGAYTVTGVVTDTANVTATDPETGDTVTVAITVTA